MKRKLLIGSVVATLSFANMSYADFTFHSNASNACDTISGQWSGVGKASNWLIGTCMYHGFGTVSSVDASGKFTLDVNADKDSGSFVCPDHAAQKLYGTCSNGVVSLTTEYGNLQGNFSENAGAASGTLSVALGLNVDVAIQFQRA